MREIKFRAWDEHAKFMDYNPDLEGETKLNTEILRMTGNFPTGEESDWFNRKFPYILMQFTGLKDKNGKEIYEGDILQTGQDFRQVVIFKNGCFQNGIAGLIRGHEIVIGNIYENPDLINAVEEPCATTTPKN